MTKPISVTHLSARLSHGGAAQVQLNLHERLLSAGHKSRIAYGYGARGGPDDARVAGATRVGTAPRAALNLAIHRLVGVDLVPPRRQPMLNLVTDADVVHAHVLHSYYMPLDWLQKQLRALHIPIVVTAHDDWLFTGRCAVPGPCDRWQVGCGRCPALDRYPQALIDLSGSESGRRRRIVRDLIDAIVAPSKHVMRKAQYLYPEIPTFLVPNGLDPGFESAVGEPAERFATAPSIDRPLLVVASDLSDPLKVNGELLNALSRAGVPVTLVGQNARQSGMTIRTKGPIVERWRLAEVMRNAAALLFMSTTDSFGLVMAEALCMGVPVLAVPSDAADAVLGELLLTSMPPSRIVELSVNKLYPAYAPYSTPGQLQRKALKRFGGEQMYQGYIRIYKELLERTREKEDRRAVR